MAGKNQNAKTECKKQPEDGGESSNLDVHQGNYSCSTGTSNKAYSQLGPAGLDSPAAASRGPRSLCHLRGDLHGPPGGYLFRQRIRHPIPSRQQTDYFRSSVPLSVDDSDHFFVILAYFGIANHFFGGLVFEKSNLAAAAARLPLFIQSTDNNPSQRLHDTQGAVLRSLRVGHR